VFNGKYLEMASFWHGGMAITGVVAGLMAGVLLFSLLYRKQFIAIADEVIVPFCLLLLMVRIGNHLNGELYGSVTGAWWGVRYPGIEGFRHPVALYEALKGLIVFFILLVIAGRAESGRGKTTGQFFLWSGLGSFIIDYFGVSSGHLALNPGTRQFFSVLVAILGLLIILHTARKPRKKYSDLNTMQFAPISFRKRRSMGRGAVFLKIVLFAVILVFCLTLPGARAQQSLKDPASPPFNQAI